MRGLRHPIAAAVSLLAVASPALAATGPDRPMGAVFSWGYELRQKNLPTWRPDRNPFTPAQWTKRMNSILGRSGQNGLWISGSTGLPFDLPINKVEPTKAWFNKANYQRLHNETGIKFDVNWELRVADLAKKRKLHKSWNIKLKIAARRYNMLGPGWQRTALREIRRVVPKHRGLPYRNYYTGVDEPMVFPPFGPATKSKLGKQFLADIMARYGQNAPAGDASPTTDPQEGLRWLAFNRYTGERYFALRGEQARLIKQLDPSALVSPNSYAWINGFIPWDYTKLADFADVVELDPYTSYDEVITRGRGRYNHGFGTKLMADLTGQRIRTIIQAFPYQGYDPKPEDVWTWATQALRAGATDLSLYGENNPIARRPAVYAAMLDIARNLRGTRLPAPPVDPANVIVYATASEGQGQPNVKIGERPRTLANQLYTTYSILGEQLHAGFVFDSDTRLVADPTRLARATTVWLPRGETLDRPFAEALVTWVRAGGTLVVTDPDAFTRAPDGSSLADLRDTLIGAGAIPNPTASLAVAVAAIDANLPSRALAVPTAPGGGGAFTQIPAGATVVATNADGSAAGLRRVVGAGQVLAFAGDVMFPGTLDAPAELVELVKAIQLWRRAPLDLASWRYEIPGNPAPGRLPWPSAVRPAYSPLP
jgi:hypothetical protein